MRDDARRMVYLWTYGRVCADGGYRLASRLLSVTPATAARYARRGYREIQSRLSWPTLNSLTFIRDLKRRWPEDYEARQLFEDMQYFVDPEGLPKAETIARRSLLGISRRRST
jgi:hypothetical protein